MRRIVLAMAVCLLMGGAPPMAWAAVGDVESMELVPIGTTTFSVDERRYGGTLEVRPDVGGLVLVEHVDLDAYLGGIREVPSSWEPEALAAQAVAARTYLAWTLQRGRQGSGRVYGFDICATEQCQVYAGLAGSAADPWRDAVRRTADELLLFDGAPAQALYSSSSGPRTRAVSDIWGGPPVPYLEAVDSPEEGVSPHYTWRVSLPVPIVVQVLRAAGYQPGGDLRSARVDGSGDGEGPAELVLVTDRGSLSVPATTIRTAFNRYGPRLYPGVMPGRRDDGSKLPQAVPSYTFTAGLVGGGPPSPLFDRLPADDRPNAATLVLEGHGWGHGVGMSQWGAEAMALSGSTYAQILGLYYGGLQPEPAGSLLPDDVAVGLGWRLGEVAVDVSGSFALLVNGAELATLPGGEWILRTSRRGVAVVPPPELVSDLSALLFGRFHPR